MDTNAVWALLGSIPVGTVVAVIIVFAAIVAAVAAGLMKLYKIFVKYKTLQDVNAKRQQMIEKHESTLAVINDSLKSIQDSLDEQKEDNDKRQELIESHDVALEKINNTLESIQESLDEQKDVNLKQIQVSIINICNEALDAGEISASKLRILEDLFEQYTSLFHGNGYVKTLVVKTRAVKVVGRLDK